MCLVQLLVLFKKSEEPAGVVRGAPELEDKGSGGRIPLEELEGDQILGFCVRLKVTLKGGIIDELRIDILRYEQG